MISVNNSHGTSYRHEHYSFWDGMYKNRHNGHSCSGVQLAKQIDSCEDTARVIVTKVVDSVFGLLPWQVLQERWSVN